MREAHVVFEWCGSGQFFFHGGQMVFDSEEESFFVNRLDDRVSNAAAKVRCRREATQKDEVGLVDRQFMRRAIAEEGFNFWCW